MSEINVRIAILLATVGLARADVIPIVIDLGPTSDHFGSEVLGDSSDLNGLIPEDGHLSFNVIFKDHNFIRLTQKTVRRGGYFGLVAYLSTTITSFDTFGMRAYTLNEDGNRNSAIFDSGHWADSSPFPFSFGMGVNPLNDLAGRLRPDLMLPFTFYGAHFEFDFPNQVGEELSNLNLSTSSNVFWGVGPHVPDAGATLPMLGLALTGLLMLVKPTK